MMLTFVPNECVSNEKAEKRDVLQFLQVCELMIIDFLCTKFIDGLEKDNSFELLLSWTNQKFNDPSAKLR